MPNPPMLPEKTKGGFQLTITIFLIFSGIPETQTIQYSGLCRTKKKSKFQEICSKDAIMVMLKEVLPVAFHKLEIKLIKEQIMTRVGSNYSTTSSTHSDSSNSFPFSTSINGANQYRRFQNQSLLPMQTPQPPIQTPQPQYIL